MLAIRALVEVLKKLSPRDLAFVEHEDIAVRGTFFRARGRVGAAEDDQLPSPPGIALPSEKAMDFCGSMAEKADHFGPLEVVVL